MTATPGPWTYEMRNLYEINIVAGNRIIATIHDGDLVEALDDANLMAASQEMYEALKAIREYFTVLVNEHPPEAIQPFYKVTNALARVENRS
jgi:flagellar biosynthesis regulator FlbT